MEPLLTAFAAALLGGWADKTQAVTAMLAERFRSRAILFALILAAGVNCLVSAYAGALLRLEISLHAATLLLTVALAFAGVVGLIGEKAKAPPPRGGPFLTALTAFFAAGWGDRSQYLIAALAAYYGSAPLVAAAGFAGTLAVTVPALAGDAFSRAAPLKLLRILFGLGFLIAAAALLVNALGLV